MCRVKEQAEEVPYTGMFVVAITKIPSKGGYQNEFGVYVEEI